MKLFPGICGAVILAALLPTGCTSSARHYEASALKPEIEVYGPSQVSIGESQRVVAHTKDSAGARSIVWTVEPSTAKISPEGNTASQSAMFQADQAGRYIVKARIDPGAGAAPVESSVTVDVVGTVTSNR